MDPVLLSAESALVAFTIAQAMRWAATMHKSTPSQMRALWSLACAGLWIHVLLAFGIAHHWSHDAAWAHTAQRTAAAVGWNSGIGLLLNEVLLLGWTADVLWSWISPPTCEKRSRWWTISLELYLAFMFFNASIPFAPPQRRWIGIIAMATLALVWLLSIRPPKSLPPLNQKHLQGE